MIREGSYPRVMGMAKHRKFNNWKETNSSLSNIYTHICSSPVLHYLSVEEDRASTGAQREQTGFVVMRG